MLNLALFKEFDLSERFKIRMQTQITNLMNHPNFGNPVTNLVSPTYGQILGLATANDLGPRRVLLGLRLAF